MVPLPIPPRGILPAVRAIATPPIVRRAWLTAALSLSERLITPATAWLVFRPTLADKLLASVILGAVVTGRAFAQRVFAARTEAELYVRVVDSVLDGDVLRASVLPDEDARIEIAQAVFHATQTVSRDLPVLGADVAGTAILAVVVLSIEPARMVAMAVALTLVGLVALLVSRRSMEAAIARTWKARERVHSAVVDALDGKLEIVAAGRRAEFMADMAERGRLWAIASVRNALGSIVSGRLPLVAIGGLVAAVVLVVGSRWRAYFTVSLADVALLAGVTPAFAGVAQGLVALASNRKWAEMVARVVRAPRLAHGGGRPPPARPARIAFEGVSFRYEASSSSHDALHDVTFHISRSLLALSGPNGSGKSTCLRLLLGLAAPSGGRILVDGVPLGELAIDEWRSRVAFLPQRPYLPPRRDIRAAIRFLAPQATEEVMVQALERVGLRPSLGRGESSLLSVGVDTLSVGQRQRVGLARLLCRKASVYLLDEPDANLDREGIALVGELIRALAREGIVILAAHTTELLELADEAIVLDAGRVVRFGGPSA